jgi:hypothetical protein
MPCTSWGVTHPQLNHLNLISQFKLQKVTLIHAFSNNLINILQVMDYVIVITLFNLVGVTINGAQNFLFQFICLSHMRWI